MDFRYLPGDILWKLKATHGLPLDMSLMRCAQEHIIPIWLPLFLAAQKDGTNLEVLARELAFYCREAYSQEIGEVLAKCMTKMPGYISARIAGS